MKKRLILITLAIALLVLGINLITRGEYLSGKVEAYLVDMARTDLGYDVGMEKVVFNFFPAYVDLMGPYVSGWDESDPENSVSARKVRVYFGMAALLQKELNIRRIQVYGPSTRIVKLADGGYNIDPLVDKVRALAEADREDAEFKSDIKEVVLFGAHFNYRDPAQDIHIRVGDAGVDLRFMGEGRMRAGYRFKEVEARRGHDSPFHLSGGGDVFVEEGVARMEGVRFAAEGTDIRASGTVGLLGDAPVINLRVDAALDLELLDRLGIVKGGPSGRAKLTGVVKGAYPELGGSGRLSVKDMEFAGLEVDDFVSSIEFDGFSVSLPDVRCGLLGGGIKGSLVVHLDGDEPSYASSWVLSELVSGRFTESREDLNFIPWHWVSGTVDVSGQGLSLPAMTASGSLELRRYTLRHDAPHASVDLDIIKTVSIDFDIADGAIRAHDAVISTSGTVINCTGTVGMDGASDLVLKGHSDDIGEIASIIGYDEMRGKADLTAYMRGNIVEPVIFGKGVITDAYAGEVYFRSAQGDIELKGWQLFFKEFTINQEYGSFLLNGKIAFQSDGGSFERPYFKATLGVTDADVRKITTIFYEDIPVNLTAEGELGFEGTEDDFSGTAHLVTGGGDVYGQAVDKGEVWAELGTGRITFPKVVAIRDRDIVTASGFIGFDGTFGAEAASARFDLENFDLLAGTGLPLTGSLSLAVSGSGSFDEPEFTFNISPYRVYIKDVDLEAGAVTAKISGGMLTVGGSMLKDRVRLSASLGLDAPYRWSGRLSFDEGRFEPFVKLAYEELPPDVTLTATGELSGHGELDDPAKDSFTLDFSKLVVDVMGRRLENDGPVDVGYKSGGLYVSALKLKGEGVNLEVRGGAKSTETVDFGIRAQTDLDIVKKFVEDTVDFIDGDMVADIKVTGDISDPLVYGKVTVANAGVKLKDFPQRFDELSGEVEFQGADFTLKRLDANLGGGSITADGKGSLKGLSLDSFSILIKSAGVKVKYPEGLTTTLNSELYFEGAEHRRSITGEITVTEARYNERVDWKSWLVQFKKRREEIVTREPSPALDIALNVHITADETIRIKNNVANIPASADLSVRGTLNRPVLLGRFQATEGQVFLRNNAFTLINGVAEFVDPARINPIIDLQGETRVREYLIQLTLTGTLDRITVTLLSDPPLEDDDIVALLALGRTTAGIAGHESALTTGEATSFVTGRLQDAVESRLRTITGFDRFQIDPYLTSSGASTGPRLTVGKSLFKEKLYITFSSNLGTAEDQFVRLEYIFNKNFSVVGERDELGRIGGDLKFRFTFR